MHLILLGVATGSGYYSSNVALMSCSISDMSLSAVTQARPIHIFPWCTYVQTEMRRKAVLSDGSDSAAGVAHHTRVTTADNRKPTQLLRTIFSKLFVTSLAD